MAVIACGRDVRAGKVPVPTGRTTRHVGKVDGMVLVIAHQKTEHASLHTAVASL